MNRKTTRRELAALAAASLTAAAAIAQTPAAPQDFDKAALDSHRGNSETLAKFDIPMSLEPAFQFRA